jgi:hypothetical protein
VNPRRNVRRHVLQQTTHPISTSGLMITHTLSSVDRWGAQLSALHRRAVLLADRRDHPRPAAGVPVNPWWRARGEKR